MLSDTLSYTANVNQYNRRRIGPGSVSLFKGNTVMQFTGGRGRNVG